MVESWWSRPEQPVERQKRPQWYTEINLEPQMPLW